MANVSMDRRRASFAERVEAWLGAWVAAFREAAQQAELRRKLRHVDDHMLRDMGITWNGRGYERTKTGAPDGHTDESAQK